MLTPPSPLILLLLLLVPREPSICQGVQGSMVDEVISPTYLSCAPGKSSPSTAAAGKFWFGSSKAEASRLVQTLANVFLSLFVFVYHLQPKNKVRRIVFVFSSDTEFNNAKEWTHLITLRQTFINEVRPFLFVATVSIKGTSLPFVCFRFASLLTPAARKH